METTVLIGGRVSCSCLRWSLRGPARARKASPTAGLGSPQAKNRSADNGETMEHNPQGLEDRESALSLLSEKDRRFCEQNLAYQAERSKAARRAHARAARQNPNRVPLTGVPMIRRAGEDWRPADPAERLSPADRAAMRTYRMSLNLPP